MILGSISSIETGGLTVLIDGEDTPTTKEYCYLSSYLPVAGDRVMIEEINGTYVVLGKVVQTSSGETYADHAGYADTAGYAETASTAAYATSAGTAARCTTASYADSATSASSANFANSASSAYSCSTASFAASCSTASTAVSASTATSVQDQNYPSYGRIFFKVSGSELQFATSQYGGYTTLANK